MHQNQNVARTRLYEYLPAIYREEGSDAQSNHLCEFLEGLEKVLLGFEEPDHSAGKGKPPHPHAGAVEGLGKEIERLYTLFAPLGDPDKKIGQADKRTPGDFLPWLASWAALALHSGMDLDRQRELIAQIIPLYRKRGTKSYMEDLLTLCVDCDTSVHEEEIPAMQIGVHSTVGEDMHIAGGPPHFFRVVLTAPKLKAEEVQIRRQMAYEVVELAKPAHTTYEFEVNSPQMQVGIHSTVGLDTLLGPASGVKA